jgi:bacteriocin-like protein
MKNSLQGLTNLLTKAEQISTEKLAAIKGGCGTISDPKRCTK